METATLFGVTSDLYIYITGVCLQHDRSQHVPALKALVLPKAQYKDAQSYFFVVPTIVLLVA